jgi:hypothetical protein
VLISIWLWQPAPVRRVVLDCWVIGWAFTETPLSILMPAGRYTQDLADLGQREKAAVFFSWRPFLPSNARPALVAMLRDDSVSDRAKVAIASRLKRELDFSREQQWVRDTNATGALVDVASKVGSEAGDTAILALSRVNPALLTREDYRRLAELRDKEPDDVRGRYRRDEIDAILATNPYAPTRP